MSRPARPAATDGPGVLARAAALAAGGCALAHGFLLTSAPEGWTTVAQAGLAMACVACAVHLWRRPRPAAWTMHALLA